MNAARIVFFLGDMGWQPEKFPYRFSFKPFKGALLIALAYSE
jgi:hypothetical protein